MKIRVREIIEKLVTFYNFNIEECEVYKLSRELTCYEFIILTILSQNTSDKLARKAFNNILNVFKRPLNPVDIINNVEKVLECIKVSGMYRRKIEAIVNISRLVLERGDRYLEVEDPEKLRSTLLNLKGIGKKCVDVFLLFKRDYPTFPVDTHISRICTRIPLSNSCNYDNISSIFIKEFHNDVEKLKISHLVLIHHGRELCKSRNPRCHICPISNICEYVNIRKVV